MICDLMIQESPILVYVGSINVNSFDDKTLQDAKLSEHDKARELLYAMYGLE